MVAAMNSEPAKATTPIRAKVCHCARKLFVIARKKSLTSLLIYLPRNSLSLLVPRLQSDARLKKRLISVYDEFTNKNPTI